MTQEMKDQMPKLKVSPLDVKLLNILSRNHCHVSYLATLLLSVQTLVIKPGAAFLFTVRFETLGHFRRTSGRLSMPGRRTGDGKAEAN